MLRKAMFVLLLLPTLALSGSEGEKLVKDFWKWTVEKRIHKIASTISPSFQGMYMSSLCAQTGDFFTKAQELQFLRNLNITSFVLSNIKTTKNHHALVVTYNAQLFSPAQAPVGMDLPNPYANYHEIFTYFKHEGKWKLISVSFFPYGVPV